LGLYALKVKIAIYRKVSKGSSYLSCWDWKILSE